MPSEDELSPTEVLAKKHRKEKKELQAHIQALKKTSSKGDKKKKKEVAEEILSLEKALNERHNNELKDLEETNLGKVTNSLSETTIDTEETTDVPEKENSNHERVSRAQKRRNKKAEKEKARLCDIEKQEEENKIGVRQLEIEKMNKLLASKELALVEMPSNGDCLYASVSHQIQASRIGLLLDVGKLREMTAKELTANKDHYWPFLTHPTTGEMLSDEDFVEYCNNIANTKCWGGQVELMALSRCLRAQIEVLQTEGSSVLIGEEDFDNDRKITVTYHRHMFSLGEHYNSTEPLKS